MASSKNLKNIVICLFRNDLRLHDNPVLLQSHTSRSDITHVLHLYVFDPRQFDISRVPNLKGPGGKGYESPKTWNFKFPKCGRHRTRFILESLQDLQNSFRTRNSDILFRFGKPEVVVPRLAKQLVKKQYNVLGVYLAKEFTHEELLVENRLTASCRRLPTPVPVRILPGASTIVQPSDLPFQSINHLPDVFTQFRTKVEANRDDCVRECVEVPKVFKPAPQPTDFDAVVEEGDEDTGNDENAQPPMGASLSTYFPHLMTPNPASKTASSPEEHQHDPRTAFPFRGGETAALARLKHYLYGTDAIKTYKDTRNGLLGSEYSTKFSPWLSVGAISARKIAWEVWGYEDERGATKGTYWLWFELLWREYFKFVAMKYGNRIFFQEGISPPSTGNKKPIVWKNDKVGAKRWMDGQTGVPFVDANMRELRATGFMSNRGRQNVASFLTKDLNVDWRLGAEWFECLLLDHDPCSNYGNWLYVSGLGNDPREDRHFNMVKQGKDYDPEGEYVGTWCPELKGVPAGMIHTPWKMSPQAFEAANLDLVPYSSTPSIDNNNNSSYPTPILTLPAWDRHSGRDDAGKAGRGNPGEKVGAHTRQQHQQRGKHGQQSQQGGNNNKNAGKRRNRVVGLGGEGEQGGAGGEGGSAGSQRRGGGWSARGR
ncbi:hypothetical protein HK102_001002 [Quaeritorhiza haematococci]|nr:hypothetical protein HK102_001002 [Quaeritorhiza haematococci]